MSGLAARIVFGILAGGAGRRVGGADKGWLLRNGRPQIEVLIDAIRAVEQRLGLPPSRLLISANRNLEDYARLADAVIPDGDGIDAFPGPLIGVMRLLQAIQPEERLITLPVDAVPDDALDQAIAVLLQARADIITVIDDPSGTQPLFTSYPGSVQVDCAAAVQRGERSVNAWQCGSDPNHRLVEAVLGNFNHVPAA
ncbi:MAG: NTP transferase domain-containing protein [Lysobacteraceae bacterium]